MELESNVIEKPVVAWGYAAAEKGNACDDARHPAAEPVRLDLGLCDSEFRFVVDRA